MAVSIKEEGLLMLDPNIDFSSNQTHFQVSRNLGLSDHLDIDEVEDEVAGDFEENLLHETRDLTEKTPDTLRNKGPPADIELEKLPRPSSALNCRQARSYLVKLLRAANGGQNPQYGNPNSKPPFWPDYYWPWAKLTDVHTKPRGMEEPLLYSEMMKLAIQRGYKYYGYDPETYWDKAVEDKEPSPVERGTPAPIHTRQVQNLGPPPKLPRPNSKLNCVQARTVLSKLLRYQQAGNNPVYGHPETRPPWWPDECIRWTDMVDLRGKPPYLPKDMTYTDVLKHAIDKGLKFFGFDCETWIDSAQYNREINHSLLSKRPVVSVSENPVEGPPKLPIPINKMNCGLARTTLSRLLRFHCGKNPKYGTLESMPVWWPNDVFDWTALKNLSHRYDGNLGDSYSNCLRLAIVQGYEYYRKDPYNYTEETGEDLPTVAAIKRIKLAINPQVSAMIDQFDEDIADDPDLVDAESNISNEDSLDIDENSNLDDLKTDTAKDNTTPMLTNLSSTQSRKRPPPPLISISDINSFTDQTIPPTEYPHFKFLVGPSPPKMARPPHVSRPIPTSGKFPPLVSVRSARLDPSSRRSLRRCRVDLTRLGLQQIDEPAVLCHQDLLTIARSECDSALLNRLGRGCLKDDKFSDLDLVFQDGVVRAHRLVLAAASPLLSLLLTEDRSSCLIFPEVSLQEGRLAVEALYTGSVVIRRQANLSLSTVERCVRAFQEVGLLTGYSIQISPALPLSRVRATSVGQGTSVSPPPGISSCSPQSGDSVVSPQHGYEDWSQTQSPYTDIAQQCNSARESEEESEENLTDSEIPDLEQVDRENLISDSQVTNHTTVSSTVDHLGTEQKYAVEEDITANQEENGTTVVNECSSTDLEFLSITNVCTSPEKGGPSHTEENTWPNKGLVSDRQEGSAIEYTSTDEKKNESVTKCTSSIEECISNVKESVTDNLGSSKLPISNNIQKAGISVCLRKSTSPIKDYISPRKDSSRPSRECTSPRKESLSPAKEYNRPKFSEICPETISLHSGLGQKAVVEWLMKTSFLPAQGPSCRGCSRGTVLQPTEGNIDGFLWVCPAKVKCVKGPASFSVRDQTIFQFNCKESLTWILRILSCWRDNTSLTTCHQETGASIDTIFFWYEKCRQFFGQLKEEGED